jgi:Lar family restriction alleviation protein
MRAIEFDFRHEDSCPVCGKMPDMLFNSQNNLQNGLAFRIVCRHCNLTTKYKKTKADVISAWRSRDLFSMKQEKR